MKKKSHNVKKKKKVWGHGNGEKSSKSKISNNFLKDESGEAEREITVEKNQKGGMNKLLALSILTH